MYRRLAQLLGNMSVNRKLSLGFGLVLVLTVLIAAAGWNGLASVIERGDKLASISRIIGLTKTLLARIAELDPKVNSFISLTEELALSQGLPISQRPTSQ